MHRQNLIKKLSASILILTIALVTTNFAQSSNSNPQTAKPITVDAEFLKAAQLAIAERDRYKAESDAKTEIIYAKDMQINALKGLLDVQKVISRDWQEAATARKSALAIDDKLILTYDKRIAELQAERDSARRNNKAWGVAGLVLGAGLVILAKGRN